MRLLRNQNGFTLIELIIIIVIIGILAVVAITRYVDLSGSAANGTARGVLGSLRAQNALMFSQRIVQGSTASYTMRDIAANMA